MSDGPQLSGGHIFTGRDATNPVEKGVPHFGGAVADSDGCLFLPAERQDQRCREHHQPHRLTDDTRADKEWPRPTALLIMPAGTPEGWLVKRGSRVGHMSANAQELYLDEPATATGGESTPPRLDQGFNRGRELIEPAPIRAVSSGRPVRPIPADRPAE